MGCLVPGLFKTIELKDKNVAGGAQELLDLLQTLAIYVSKNNIYYTFFA